MRVNQDFASNSVPVAEEIEGSSTSDVYVSTQSDTKALPVMGPCNFTSRTFATNYNPVDHEGHAYVGLVNQAMTCYLNSLIQSLYMTPEFRNILYEWQYAGSVQDAALNIPFQLQKLFAQLQTSNKSVLETRDLTGSFGWAGSDAYEQHDVQELCRVMLEALEHRFRKSEVHRNFIQNLFKGTLEDYIKCHGCRKERVRQDIFNDLALAVREFGATEGHKSVEEALRAFITPELLTENNKYKCETCNSYQEAEKGLRITEFPYMLMIQLKRFTLDFNNGFRIKLNDAVTFPDFLDLNSYVHVQKPKMSYASAMKKKPETIKEDSELITKSQDADGWLDRSPDCPEVKQMLKNGKYVYELFAILVHQGSATGGHYYAYVKNLEQSRWLCFNDTQVKGVDIDEVKRSFGGGSWSTNTNAYLMIYRIVDPVKNQKFVRNDDLPKHVLSKLKEWEDAESRLVNELRKVESMVKVKVLVNDERVLTDENPHGAIEFSFSKEEIFNDCLKQICERFTEMSVHMTPETITILPGTSKFKFANTRGIDVTSTIAELLSVYGSSNELIFIIEMQSTNIINLTSTCQSSMVRTLDLFTVDVVYNSVRIYKRIATCGSETMGNLRKRIDTMLGNLNSTASDMLSRLVMDGAIDDGSPLVLIDDDNQTIDKLLVAKFQIPRFYVDIGQTELLTADRSIKNFKDTKMCRIIEKRKYGHKIRIELPSADEYRQAGWKPPYEHRSTMDPCGFSFSPKIPSPPISPMNKKFCQPMYSNTVASSTNESGVVYSTAALSMPSIVTTSSSTTVSNFHVKAGPDVYSELPGPCTSPVSTHMESHFYESDMEIDCQASTNATPNVSDNEENVPPNKNLPTMENWVMQMDTAADHATANLPENAMEGCLEARPIALPLTNSERLVSYAYQYPTYAVDFLDKGYSSAFNCDYITVLVDQRQLTKVFMEWIARYLNLLPENVRLEKHYNDNDAKGYDMNLIPEESVKQSFLSVFRVSARLKVLTGLDEKLVRVVSFDLANENSPDQWPTLFVVPASAHTTIADFQVKCLNILESAYAEKVDPALIRMRDITPYGAPLLRTDCQLQDRVQWDAVIALQRIDPELVPKWNPVDFSQIVIMRRFCPSTLEIMPPFEILIPVESPSPADHIKVMISQHMNLPIERIAFSELLPRGGFSRWPFNKSQLDLYECKFVSEVPFADNYNGRALYFVDRSDHKKILTEDDKRTMRIKERVTVVNTQRRAERPLRIQMSSISESET